MFTSGFFNAINSDRKYSAEQMSQLFDGLITDGIFLTIGDQLMITEDENMTVILETGRAWFNHTWSLNDTRMPLDLDGSSDIYDRIDAIVLEVNNDPQVRQNSIKILKGTNAESEPQYPTLEKSYYVHQYPLAYISIPKRTKAITQALITNMVGTSETPFVTGILQGINIDSLVAQWQDEWSQMTNANQEEFDAWFAEIQGQLAGDVATNLQQQINEQTAKIQQAMQDIGVLQQNMDTLSGILSGDFETLQSTVSGMQSDISGIQSSLSGKQDKITGGVSSYLTDNIVANRVLRSNNNGKLDYSSVTVTELGYLSGVTSNLQTQINAKMAAYPACIELLGNPQPYIDFRYNKTSDDYTSRIIETSIGNLNIAPKNNLSIKGNVLATFIDSYLDSGNWRYWRFIDGLAICVHNAICPGNFANTAWGNGLYYSGAYVFDNFPINFISIPICLPGFSSADSGYTTIGYWIMSEGSATKTKPPRYWFVRSGSVTIGHPHMNLMVIGRWK